MAGLCQLLKNYSLGFFVEEKLTWSADVAFDIIGFAANFDCCAGVDSFFNGYFSVEPRRNFFFKGCFFILQAGDIFFYVKIFVECFLSFRAFFFR